MIYNNSYIHNTKCENIMNCDLLQFGVQSYRYFPQYASLFFYPKIPKNDVTKYKTAVICEFTIIEKLKKQKRVRGE
jgi:hypothetical protein